MVSNTLSRPISSLISLTHNGLTYDRPTLPPSKLRLFVARTDEWLSKIRPTWVKGYQLSTIQVQLTTWMKGYQLSTIRIQSQTEWKVVSHQQYECKNDLCGWWSVWLLTCMVDNLCGLSTRQKNILLWYLSADCLLIKSVGCNQTSSLVKSSASSLVLVRVYWLDDEGTPSECHRVWWRKTDTSKPSVLGRVLAR